MLKKMMIWGMVFSVAFLALTACGKEVTGRESAAEAVSTETDGWSALVSADWTEQSVKLDTGINMTYLTCGPEDGKALMLIHGATDSRVSWSQMAPELAAAGYRCYIPELRGHGKTDKPEAGAEGYTVELLSKDILNLMDQLSLDEAILVGHSLGSLITEELLITAPERCAKGILISSSAKVVNNASLEWALQGDGEGFLGVSGYDEEQKMPDEFIKSWTDTTNEDSNFKKAVYEHAKALPYHVWADVFKGFNGMDNTKRLSSVTNPVYIIWGTDDTFFTKEDQELLKESFKNAKLEYTEINNGGHNIHWDKTDTRKLMVKEIIRFIEEES